MKLGGFICEKWTTADDWADKAIKMGYSAVYFPLDYKATTKEIDEYVLAAERKNLVIAEIGVWNNTLSSEKEIRDKNINDAIHQLELADYIHAGCCVNISGSRSSQWDGPDEKNITDETFTMVVSTTQRIIDAAKPEYTFFTLEPMPWMYPYTADSYIELINAIGRTHFAVHFDPVNVISDPIKYYSNGNIIDEWFDKLGPYIKSCHAKDIKLSGKLTVHLSECRPGLGNLNYNTLLHRMSEIAQKTGLMFEHMDKKSDYDKSLAYIKSLMRKLSID